MADLGDRGHVDGVVGPPVPAPRQPVDLAPARGHLDRRGPVISSKVVPAGEPGHLADIADDGGSDDRADPEQPGQAGPGRGDRDRQLLAGLPDPGIDAAQVLKERRGQLAAAACTAPSGLIAFSTRAARAVVITLGTPPGISSPSTACSRQTTWVRVRPRSR
jgi:hypothetical protein